MNQFKIGASVVIARNINKDRREDGESYSYMDQFQGRETKITGYNDVNSYGETCWYVDIEYNGKPLSVCEVNLDMA